MKRNHNPVSDTRSESGDLATRLFRLISDVVRHLDDLRSRAESARELFSQNSEVQRAKLRDYCDKLMFADPINYGRKAEDLLWRKGFYDVVTTVKRLNMVRILDQLDLALVKCHLQSGIGHYHHLVMKLQSHYRLDLRGIVDFPLMVTDHGLKKDKNWWSNKQIESGALEWAQQAIHRCLIFLGDLSRYLTDIDSTNDHSLATRYYAQALNWKPECGMPHNQLGTLHVGKNYGLDSAYNYMRCLSCVQKFDGAEGNLQNLLENNARTVSDIKWFKESPPLQKLITGFIQIANVLFYDKQYGVFNPLCNEAMAALNVCLTEMEPIPTKGNSNSEPLKLNDDMLFKMVIISIMCVERLKSKGSAHTMGGVALSLSLISQVVQCAVTRLESVLVPRTAPPLKNGFKQRRRRRRRRSLTRTSSDLSEDDTESVCSIDTDISEEGLIFDNCNDSEDEAIPNGNGLDKHMMNGLSSYSSEDDKSKLTPEQNGILKPWLHPMILDNKTFQHVHKVCRTGYIMQSIKVCCDWLSDNVPLVKSCGPSCGLLISRLISLLNHLSAVPNLKSMKDHFDDSIITEDVLYGIALPEDVNVRGLIGLQVAQSKLNWNYLKTRVLESKQETYARICKLVQFGVLLAQSGELGMNHNEAKQWFSAELLEKNGIKPQENGRGAAPPHAGPDPSKTTRDPVRHEKLMQEMGQLWLKAEVNELESKMKKVQTNLPPYLVMDCEAFIHHPTLVKQLASAKKFIIVIPTVVVSALDEQKRSSGRVRDTIRWLESQLRHGNRFLRAQRGNEHLPLPFIKYPKKKDKEAMMFFQIVECCHFLSQQSTGDKDSELVTLITGSKTLMTNHQTGFSPLGVAKSTGVNVEHIEAFFSKWKSSSKSHG